MTEKEKVKDVEEVSNVEGEGIQSKSSDDVSSTLNIESEDLEKQKEDSEKDIEETTVSEEKVEDALTDEATADNTASVDGEEDNSESDEDSEKESDDEIIENEKNKSTEKLSEPNLSKEDFLKIKKQLQKAKEKKEKFFEIRSIISQEIKNLFSELKTLKEERDSLTKQVQSLKDQRDGINTLIKGNIEKIKTLNGGAKGFEQRINIPALKKEIEKIQYHLETNPLSPDQEKKVMKTIREKQKLIDKAKASGEFAGELKDTSKKVDNMKDESNKIHSDVRELAEKSQSKHEDLINNSKNIKYLKAREKEVHSLFTAAKNEYKVIRKQYLQNKSFYEAGKKHNKKRQNNREILKRIEEDVEKKIMSGQKITTEDLLAFRR